MGCFKLSHIFSFCHIHFPFSYPCIVVGFSSNFSSLFSQNLGHLPKVDFSSEWQRRSQISLSLLSHCARCLTFLRNTKTETSPDSKVVLTSRTGGFTEYLRKQWELEEKTDSVSMIYPVSALFFYICLMKGSWSHCNEQNDFWEHPRQSINSSTRETQAVKSYWV